ncbi:MAG: heparinase II/III family protein [Paracoccus sp. (in: a-proteobacteria)]|uniref:heparinase II/III family protein n=1 Tax=Paracoccus sp. TaxID=267 RepID=UPI0026DF1644|nr:heparinase II/III family protein [Paracoccus sp. (in: a-proteobacteria)]MDO5621702.1 heparinase II/III family protein [Paracoccus sp. (in: a-proteobacteria)]
MSDDRPHGFTRPPEPKALGNPTRGQDIVGGELRLPGGTLNGDPFTQKPPSAGYADELHGFRWLDDLAAVNTPAARSLAQARVLDWIAAHPNPDDSREWRPSITGRRVLRWVFHGGMILPGLDRDRSGPIFDSLHEQLAHLTTHWAEAPSGPARIEALAGLFIAATSLKGAEMRAAAALNGLADQMVVMADGTLPSRNPEQLLDCFALLVWVSEAAATHGITLPQQIRDTIDRTAPVLRSLRHADGMLPRFHGGGRGAPGRLDQCLRAAKGPALTEPGLAMGYARMARGRTTLMLDAAAPPSGRDARTAHASTLGFELTVARVPLVVSCGSGRMFGAAWSRASRATPCHSTLCVTGLSSSRLERGAKGAGDRLTDLPTRVWAGEADADGNLLPPDTGPAHTAEVAHLLAGHNGWQDSHGLTHMRELWLEPDGLRLMGEDSLAALNDAQMAQLQQATGGMPLPFTIRFHLHPDIGAEIVDNWVALDLPGGELWQFGHDGVAELSLEPTAWLDSSLPQPVASQQIVLTTELAAQGIQIGWTFAQARFS